MAMPASFTPDGVAAEGPALGWGEGWVGGRAYENIISPERSTSKEQHHRFSRVAESFHPLSYLDTPDPAYYLFMYLFLPQTAGRTTCTVYRQQPSDLHSMHIYTPALSYVLAAFYHSEARMSDMSCASCRIDHFHIPQSITQSCAL